MAQENDDFSGTLNELMKRSCIRLKKSQKFYLYIKRLLDILAALSGLILLFPLFIIISAAIKAEDPEGHILYSQQRIGRKGIPFNLYKFRSMKAGTPELSTKEFTNAESYVTNVGRFLRKTSIDELPQLWNVLVGNMSLIGPRPLLPKEREVHMMRFVYGLYQVRPGITGLAQTHGRDNMNDCDKVRWDRTYVRNISPLMDITLVLRTFFKVAACEGVWDSKKVPVQAEARKKAREPIH